MIIKIKMQYLILSFYILALLVGESCGASSKSKTGIYPKGMGMVELLDSTQAAKHILTDTRDGFFDHLSIADMSIQMKKSDVSTDRQEVLKQYRRYLSKEVSDFSNDERKFVLETVSKAKGLIDKINPKLWEPGLKIGKIKTNHYGEDVFYTRDKVIFFPENIFSSQNSGDFMPVFLHELFHVLSRYHHDFREQMYGLIGFSKLDMPVKLPARIADRQLTNPDGVTMDYGIALTDKEDRVVRALPLLVSPKEKFDPKMPEFFSYLKFDLYPLKKEGGYYTLDINDKGESLLSIEHNADFFKKIGDNTQYVIHPDEIMAENFMLAAMTVHDDNMKKYSTGGQELLRKVLEIMRNFGN